MCHQCDVAFVVRWLEIRHVASVENVEAPAVNVVVSNLVKDVDECVVGLSVDMVELDAEERRFLKYVTVKEIH